MSSRKNLHNEETSVSTIFYSKHLPLLKKKHFLDDKNKPRNETIPPLGVDKNSNASSKNHSSNKGEIHKINLCSLADCHICFCKEHNLEVDTSSVCSSFKLLSCTICNCKVHYQCLKDLKKLQKKPLSIGQQENQFLCEGCSYSLSNYEQTKCFICGNKEAIFMFNDQMAHFFCYILFVLKLKQSKTIEKTHKCTICFCKKQNFNPLINCDSTGCDCKIHLSCFMNSYHLFESIKIFSKYLSRILKLGKINSEKIFFCTKHQTVKDITSFPEVNVSLSNPTIYTKESSFGDDSNFNIKSDKKPVNIDSITSSKNNNLSFNEALDKIDDIITNDISNLSNGSNLNLIDYTRFKSLIEKVLVNYSAIDSELEDL